jgi:hypothetical protein
VTRILAITILVSVAVVCLPVHGQVPIGQSASAPRLMTNREFAFFLKRLDSRLLRWEAELRNVHVKSMRLAAEKGKKLDTSYDTC